MTNDTWTVQARAESGQILEAIHRSMDGFVATQEEIVALGHEKARLEREVALARRGTGASIPGLHRRIQGVEDRLLPLKRRAVSIAARHLLVLHEENMALRAELLALRGAGIPHLPRVAPATDLLRLAADLLDEAQPKAARNAALAALAQIIDKVGI